MKPQLEETEELVLGLMRGEVGFEEALAGVVRYQLAWNAPLAEYWRGRGFTGEGGDLRHRVPAVPTDVFRHVRLVSSEREPTRVFRTSGTTVGLRGESPRLSTAVYDAGALLQFRRLVLEGAGFRGGGGARCKLVNLLPLPEKASDSSLVHMVEVFGRELGVPTAWLLGERGIVEEEFRLAIGGGPVVLFTTAFALVELLDVLSAPVRLPAGSVVIETGGFKGRSRELDRGELYGLVVEKLGVPWERIRSEYSMTELSSQLYSLPASEGEVQRLAAPEWCYVSAVDAETLSECAEGEVGILRFVDLANVDTVVAVQTADMGVRNGDGTITLLGRAPGAVPRGCSLAAEEILARVGGGAV